MQHLLERWTPRKCPPFFKDYNCLSCLNCLLPGDQCWYWLSIFFPSQVRSLKYWRLFWKTVLILHMHSFQMVFIWQKVQASLREKEAWRGCSLAALSLLFLHACFTALEMEPVPCVRARKVFDTWASPQLSGLPFSCFYGGGIWLESEVNQLSIPPYNLWGFVH